MRNQFIGEIPQSVRAGMDRDVAEQLDTLLDDMDLSEDVVDDDVDALWGLRRLMD